MSPHPTCTKQPNPKKDFIEILNWRTNIKWWPLINWGHFWRKVMSPSSSSPLYFIGCSWTFSCPTATQCHWKLRPCIQMTTMFSWPLFGVTCVKFFFVYFTFLNKQKPLHHCPKFFYMNAHNESAIGGSVSVSRLCPRVSETGAKRGTNVPSVQQ